MSLKTAATLSAILAAAVLVPACSEGDTGPAGADGAPGSADAWSRAGNAGTNPATNFAGTTDAQAFEVRVNSLRALRVEPATVPNLIGGDAANLAGTGVTGGTVSGGGTVGDPNRVLDDHATVGGGRGNMAGDGAGTTTDRAYATVGGGRNNAALGLESTVSGGLQNAATAEHATASGGTNNEAIGLGSTAGGGRFNLAAGPLATVSGGQSNIADGNYGVVAGGLNNWLRANAAYGAIGGGDANEVVGLAATVPGGQGNLAEGSRSFAAGTRAFAFHPGSFVWADGTQGAMLQSGANFEMTVLASGGTRIYSASNLSTGVVLSAGGGAWAAVSDRAAKTDFRAVDPRETLRKVAALPIESWRYRAAAPEVRHMGPVAQDFRASFGLGTDERTIHTIDADGVALSAIQGLVAELRDRDARIERLENRLAAMEERLSRIEAR